MDINQLVSKNQSIKIVPSLEESLRSIGLNVDLDVSLIHWLEQLKITWKTWKKSTAIESRVENFFQSVPDPYRVALLFVIKCEDLKDCKPKSLPYFIIETLQKWAMSTGALPEDVLKLPAFRIAIQQRNQQFLNLMVKAYYIVTIKDLILPIVKEMISNDNCKQASQIVIAMELYEDIPVEELLFPLILQDKANMIDEYLCECPSQVEPLLLYLDNLLNRQISIREHVQKYIEDHKISHVKYEKIHYKPLGKLVARLCNKFNYPIERCKNLSRNRITGGLRYLIHQRYDGHNVNTLVWDDLVKDSLRQNAGSGQEFIDMLVDYDRNEALKWATYLNLSENDLPLALRDMSLAEANDTENWDVESRDSKEYYKMSLTSDQIIMIDTGEKFYDLMISRLKGCNIVSIDCEWKPSFGATQFQVALIQVATVDSVYLIDTLLLNKQQYSSFWHTFNKSLLDNGEIIKLGFGLEQDLKEMKTSIIGLGNIKLKGEGLLDLCVLWKCLISHGLILPYSDKGGNSLSCLVHACFGLPLEKAEQCSNWEIRPLRATQIQYAAVDAFVLMKIYQFLQKLCFQQKINFDEICNDVMLESKKKASKKIKTAEKLQSTVANPQSKSPNELKIMVESKLSSLIPYLRYCGIDTTMILPSMLWCDTINLAISEERFILLSKLKCTPTVNFPQSSILDVGIGSIKEQLQSFLKHLNINIKQDNLLNFCLKCNNSDLKKMDARGIYDFCDDQSAANIQFSSKYVPDDDECDDNYVNFLSEDEDDDLVNMQPLPNNLTQGRTFKTSKGVPIEINDLYRLSLTQNAVYLCEYCGKLYWDGDEFIQPVRELVLKLTNLSIW
ncbi:exonuclease mut-7 homolog [Amyelois transitella]|uniref:exonuclease mut-7 homolog n=1 Tax=Amyelois transitella TaxID=680683 RepID=UPI0029908011|nr:exonuclease mut-7 homolog [Amyelois transitella]